MLSHQHSTSHTQRPVLASVSHHYVRNGAVVIYLAADRQSANNDVFIVPDWQPSAILWLAEEIAMRYLVDVFLVADAPLNILSTQRLAMLGSPSHPIHPFRRERTMPLTVMPVVLSSVVNHDNVPPIIHISTNAAGITIAYTHQGRPSNDLSSFVRISISSFIIVSF